MLLGLGQSKKLIKARQEREILRLLGQWIIMAKEKKKLEGKNIGFGVIKSNLPGRSAASPCYFKIKHRR